ncbi:Acid shock protein [Thalassocella blandensis]|nr:Acid shock protein [Thalassocella blandensis]
MSLIPRNSIFDLDNFFDNSFGHSLWPSSKRISEELATFSPRVDVKEKDNTYEITAELPGISKEDISLDLQNGVLSLKAETRHESKEEKDGRVIRQERRYGTYYRSFDLGGDIQESDIHADFENGVLKVIAPKAAKEVIQSKRISIN